MTFPLTGGTVTYNIDGLGRPVGRHRTGSSPSVRRYLLGEGNRVVAEYNENGTIVSQFVYATRSHVPDYMIQGSNVYRFVTDQLGSVRLVVNDNASSASASVVKQINYDAWGNITSETGTIDQPFGFAGGLQDRDTGLVHFGAREYDPFTGRWLQKDPIRFAGGDTNLYAYAGNDPVNRVDPTGLDDLSFGFEGELIGILGPEGGAGVVVDTDSPWESGVFGQIGPGAGANVGISPCAGIAFDELEGWGGDLDVNFGSVSPTILFDDKGWNGFSLGRGPGSGVSVGASHTWTLTISDIAAWLSGP